MKHYSKLGLIIGVMLIYTNSYSQTIRYYYDAVGNRTEKVIDMGEGKGSGTAEKTKNAYKESPIDEGIPEKTLKDETFPEQQIKIYPNPTRGLIRLEIPEDPNKNEEIRIIVQDLNGRMIINKSKEALMTELDLNGQPDGIYFLKLKKGLKISQWKIIKK